MLVRVRSRVFHEDGELRLRGAALEPRAHGLAIAVAVLALVPAADAREWDFEAGADGFPVASDGNRWVTSVADGAYRVRVCKPMTRVLKGPDFAVEGDFRLEGRMRYANACWHDTYGLAFAPAADFSSYYLIKWIQGDLGCQRYQVTKHGGGVRAQMFSDWIFPLGHFNAGNEWNHWRIERRHGVLSFYLNGDFAFELADYDAWDHVYMGVLVSTFENSCDGPHNDTECVEGTEIHFDDLRFEALDTGPSMCRRDRDCAGGRCDEAGPMCVPGAAPEGQTLVRTGDPGIDLPRGTPRAGDDRTGTPFTEAQRVGTLRSTVR